MLWRALISTLFPRCVSSLLGADEGGDCLVSGEGSRSNSPTPEGGLIGGGWQQLDDIETAEEGQVGYWNDRSGRAEKEGISNTGGGRRCSTSLVARHTKF